MNSSLTLDSLFRRVVQKEILGQYTGLPAPLLSQQVLDVTSDSRKVKAGSVFVAVEGVSSDGHGFLNLALESGALLMVGQKPRPSDLKGTYLQVADSKRVLGVLASAFQNNPSLAMKVIGVTGTSGKTTTTYLIESILRQAYGQVGVIGTIEFRTGKRTIPSTHTTPGAVELQAILAEMKSDGCQAVVMEVSSHALKQARTYGIAFDAMVFTNLSPEHLDYHLDMEDYFQSKALLFTEYFDYSKIAGKNPALLSYSGSEYSKRLTKIAHGKVISVAEWNALRCDLDGVHGNLLGCKIESKLVGEFNSYNVATAVSTAHALGISVELIEKGVSQLNGVPGRLESVPNKRGIHVLVDYAHKPDALEKVLTALGQLTQKNGKRIITVFGCGGDRDKLKRPIMAQIAVKNSDLVIITSDNPRTEKPEAIIKEIETGISTATDRMKTQTEVDRKKAIGLALIEAKRGDVVLIAGKGHETYQIIGTQKIHFDDREVAEEFLR